MLCYRDKSFCDQPNCKKFNKCPSAIKLADITEAEKLGLDVCYSQFKDCYEPREK